MEKIGFCLALLGIMCLLWSNFHHKMEAEKFEQMHDTISSGFHKLATDVEEVCPELLPVNLDEPQSD